MRVLMCHNRYVHRGGEDLSFESECQAVQDAGHDVRTLVLTNEDASRASFTLLRSLWNAKFNREVYERVRKICRQWRPSVAHVHNFWFALSPAVHAACQAEGVATVQSLRNFRLVCANALLMREGRICHDCLGKNLTPGIVHGCYRGSRPLSALVARMVHYNRRRDTWNRDVDRFVVLTEHGRRLFVEGGLPGERIVVKPDSVHDLGYSPMGERRRAVFIGRLSPEKGISTLLRAWKSVAGELDIVGDGPMRSEAEKLAEGEGMAGIRLHGHLEHDRAVEVLRTGAFLVMPSECYETFGRVIVEAFAIGRPVVASRLGAMAEMVAEGRNGLVFPPGNAEQLARQIDILMRNDSLRHEMGHAARRDYEAKFSPVRTTTALLDIYRSAMQSKAGRPRSPQEG